MLELSVTEIEQVNGAGDVKAGIIGYFVGKALDYAWDNRAAIMSGWQTMSQYYVPPYQA